MKRVRAARRRRRVAVITGTRAEYGVLRSPIEAIDAHPRLDLQLVVTGMHLLRKFGHTIDDILADGWNIAARVPMQTGRDDPTDQAAGLGRGVAGIARFLETAGTDIVVVLGDRIEAMAGALAATTTGRVLAHIHGGDVALGDFDESLRHAITKLAHVHLTATRESMRRVLRLGESPEHSHCVGAPGLDRLRRIIAATPPRTGRSDIALVVQHAHGRPASVEEKVATMILSAVAEAGLKRLILYPNSDRGNQGVLRAIERHARRSPGDQVQTFPSLPRDDYLRALLNADVLIGNSSSGFIEAPLAGTPVVNVGARQAGRQPGGPAITQTTESPRAIRTALRTALRKRPRRGGRSVYGDGHTGQRIARLLANLRLTPDLVRKRITY
ncbi:MAG: UDP-N-acetylglucosamine 2-epimerase (hydrolyzing) [Planctomycetes bacterium]|nr:UDP-N-acetylglucosamine 2-epimerase (hydrolyzing) [Planctomycetota bacterium]